MDRWMVICLIAAGAGFALLLVLAWVLSVKQGQALRRLAREHGWLWTTADHCRCAERAAFVQTRDDPMAVEYRHRATSVVSGVFDGISFDLCTKMRIRERRLNSTGYGTWTTCLVEVPRSVFAGQVFVYASPQGTPADPSLAAILSLGPGEGGRSAVTQPSWAHPVLEALAPLAAGLVGVQQRVLDLSGPGVPEDLAARCTIVAHEPAWADPFLRPAAQEILREHRGDWAALVFARGEQMMVMVLPVVVPVVGVYRRVGTMTTEADLLALVKLTTGLGRALGRP